MNLPAARPNVILICVDQWRGDCLGIDDHPVVQTPYLDELAIEGTRFGRAYSTTPTCIAARVGLFTGLSARTHGRVGYVDGVPWDYPVTLAGEFTRHGYQTQAVGKMHVYPERSQVGFQNVILHDGFLHHARASRRDWRAFDDYVPWLSNQLGRYEADYFEHGVQCNSMVARPWDKDEYLHPTNWVVHESLNFLHRRDPRKPFFLFMSFFHPHPPYVPPAWALDMYLDAPMPDPPVGDWAEVYAPLARPKHPSCFVGQKDPRLLRRARAGYYGLMTHLDHQIKRFTESLQDFGLHNNTYVCFTSDHGEMMGDHHLWRKGYGYEGSSRVPLILRGPEGSGIQAGLRVDAVASLHDLMTTLLSCAGLPIPSQVEGLDLLPLARGQASAVPWRPYLHGEHLILRQSMEWLTDGQEKYVWLSQSGQEQLFDLAHDPQELHDLAANDAAKERIAAWRNRLIAELTGRPEGFVQNNCLVTGRPVRPILQKQN